MTVTKFNVHMNLELYWEKRARGWITVAVYDTVKELQRAANGLRLSSVPDNFDNAIACFQPSGFPLDEARKPKLTVGGYGGIMRIVKDSTGSTVAHECVHAALSLYRRCINVNAHLGHQCGPNEETLAYLISELLEAVSAELYYRNVWEGEKK